MFEKRPSEEWIAAVRQSAKDKTNRRFLNDSIHYTKILAETMIRPATQSVDIYSGSLDRTCYEDAVVNVKCAVRILVDDLQAANWAKAGDNVTIKKAPRDMGEHFFIADGAAFRFELDHNKAMAIANFNEPEVCAELKRRFDAAWNA
ncbi:MAG: hypothetical protein HQL34_03130 [Alphaproteobacteria bacterium]|nr:hypothetical protein [Alphaproteobacteria bacterium]